MGPPGRPVVLAAGVDSKWDSGGGDVDVASKVPQILTLQRPLE